MSFIRDFLLSLREDAIEWSTGRHVWIRLLLLFYLAYAGFNHINDVTYSSWFGGLTFGLHELGHLIFRAFGEFMSIAGGSITQLAAPLIAAGILLYQRDYFGVAVAGCWESFSLYNLATYIGDAQAMQLPLVSVGGGDTYHDWEYLLVQLGLLEYDAQLALLTRVIGFITLIVSLSFGGWICFLMMKHRSDTKTREFF